MRIDFWYEWDQQRKLNKKIIGFNQSGNYKEAEETCHQLDCLRDRKRFHLAYKYNIKIPNEWIRWPYDDTRLPLYLVYRASQRMLMYSLTEEGRSELDSILRQKRREDWEWWATKIILPLLTVMIGLIGAITGAISVLKK